ncbi:MAG TPA: hypothetical protein VHA05_02610 [Candidatus Saccharimonadales bacterium]|nr:hypothetical protein [Candidatus Saccharimonadales bacterium]
MISFAMIIEAVFQMTTLPFMTQRRRYFRLAVAFGLGAAFAYLTVGRYGFSQSTGAIGEIQSKITYIGWETKVVFYGLLATPLFAVLAGIGVYLKPATYAKKTQDGYLQTSSVRAGENHPVVDPYGRDCI